ncbi:unnamed protein product, partial [Polarella glacialis]
VSHALENALRNEAALTQKLEESTARHQQDRYSLENELQLTRRSYEQQGMEAEIRIDRMKSDFQ